MRKYIKVLGFAAFIMWENNGRGHWHPIETYETLFMCHALKAAYTADQATYPNEVVIPAGRFFPAVKREELSYICLPEIVNPNL